MPQRNTKHLQEDSPKLVSPTVLNEEYLPCQQCSKLSSSSVTVLPETILVEQDLVRYNAPSLWALLLLALRKGLRRFSDFTAYPSDYQAAVNKPWWSQCTGHSFTGHKPNSHDAYLQHHLSSRWRWSCWSTAHKHLSPATTAAATTISGTPTRTNQQQQTTTTTKKSDIFLQNQDI